MTPNLILVLSLLVLLSISNTFFVVVDASYAISIEPDDEECFIFVTPTDVGFTTIIT